MRFLKNLTPCKENRRRRTKGAATAGKKRIGGGSCKFLAGIAATGALALAIGLPSLAIAGAATQGTRVADSPTANSQTLGDADSTRYDGRVWVDKSVSANESEIFDGQTVTNDSDFLVTYSALATSTEVTGGTPSDTVFILDISASMCWGTNSTHVTSEDDSRINAMVEALNASIDTIVKANPNNRIGIAVFNGTGFVLMELTPASTILKNVTDGQYVTLQDFDGDEGKDNGKATIRCNMVEGGPTAQTAGGTNIQAGLYQGMKLLANENDTTYEGVTRTPNVILMSDGAPTTFASPEDAQINGGGKQLITNKTSTNKDSEISGGSWWDLGENRDEIGQIGGGNNYYAHSADGFMALATASYMKNEISAHYYGSSDEEANVYTIGFSTNRQTQSMSTMASVVLNPAENLNADLSSVPYGLGEFDCLWDAYQDYLARKDATVYGHIGSRGNGSDVPDDGENEDFDWSDMQLLPYTVEHPSGDANDPDSFNYPTQYFEATDTESLINAFEDIAGMITKSADVPTAVTGNPVSSGYITYTDTTGQYMDVTGIKAVVWGGQLLQLSGPDTSAAGKTTYTATVHNDIFENADDAKIVITIEDGENNTQTITVQVPAAAIPVRVNNIELAADGTVKSNKSNGVTPLRVCYTVGLDQTGDDAVSPATLAGVSADYIAANISNGKVSFYSNQYQQGAENPEGAQVTFTPSNTNPFYFLQEDTPIYTSETGDEQVSSFDAEKSYWVPVSYFDGTEVVETRVERSGESMDGYTKTIDGHVYIEAGAPRLGNLEDVTGAKGTGANATGTADTYRRPTFTGTPGDEQNSEFVVYLGNNGRLDLSVPSSLTVTKATTAGTGLVAPDREFSFQITSEAMKGQTATATKTTPGTDGSASTTEGVTLAFGESGVASFTLKGGQSLEIPLPQGAAYSIVEQDATSGGYKLTGISGATTNNVNAATASGTMGTSDVTVTFTNTYEATGTMPLTITKTLQSRPFQEGDSFGFTVTQDEKNPAGGATLSSDSVTIAYNADDGENTTKKTADPLTVTFSQKGDYTFYVSETVPADATNLDVTDADGSPISYKNATDDQKAEPGWTYKGVTYDNQAKMVTVSVSDDGKGTLTANPASATVDFTNAYSSTGTTTVDTEAVFGLTKKFTGTPWDGQEFEFTITPSDGAPVPKDASGNDVTSIKVSQPDQENGDTAALDFGTLTFDQGDKGKTYTYTIQETEGTNLGIDYDTAQRVVTVYVFDDLNGGLGTSVTLTQGDKVISNTYGTELDYDAQGGIQIVKNLTGHDIEASQFEFTLTPADKASAEQVGLRYDEATQAAESKSFSTHGTQMTGEGTATETIYVFDQQQFTLDFDQSDDEGTFTYYLTESKGGDVSQGYANDTRTYTVTITVADDPATGVLEAKTVVSDGTGAAPVTYVSNNNGMSQTAQVVFNNSYNPETTLGGQGSASIVAHKELVNGEMAGGEFSFVVKDKAGNTVTTGTNEADGTITFDSVTYDVDKLVADATADEPTASYDAQTNTYSYVYIVTEDTASLPSYITPGAASAQVTVNVTDDGNGRLTCSVDYGGQQSGLTFVNTYGEDQPQVISLAGFKELDADPGLTKPDIEGKFTFTLSGTDEEGSPAPLPVDDQGNAVFSATNDSAGNVSFGTITLTMESVFGDEPVGSGSDAAATLQPRSKTYTYKVTESGSVTGVTNDTVSTKTFTVTVTDNRQGGLSVVCTDSNGNVLQPGALFSFTNTYDVPSVTSTPTSSGITITKQLSGRALNKDEFSFEMRDASGDVVSTGTNAADGAVALSPVEFSVPGTYEYTIHEVKGSLGGVSYDDAVYYATATVEQNVDDATLSVTWKVSATQGGDPLTSVAFENAYEPAPVSVTLGGTKVLDGRELEAGEFSFVLTASDGSELETVTNTDRGGFAFGPIAYSGPGTYEYTISEVKGDVEGVTYDDATYAVKVVVTDDGQGQLQVSELTYNGEASLPVFTNTYTAPEGPAPTIPETGDTTNAAVPVLVAVVGAAAIAVTVIARRRRR